MATPDLAALQAQVEKLKRDYTELTKKPAALFDIDNPEKAEKAIKALTDQIELAKEKAARLEEGFGGIYDEVTAIVSELKKTQQPIDLATKAFKGIRSITEKLKYDQQGISELSLKELKNSKKKLESLQEQVRTQANSLVASRGLQNSSGLQLEKYLKASIAMGSITEEQAALIRGSKEGFTVFQRMNDELDKRLELEKKVQSGLGITGGLLKGISKIPILGDMFDASDAVEEMEAHLREVDKDGKQINSNISALKVGLKNVKGQIIDGLLNPANLIVGFITQIVSAFKAVDSGIGDMAKGLDMSYNSTANLRMELTDIANFSGDVAVNTRGLQESLMAVSQTMGVNARLSTQDLVTFTKLREQAGYTNDELVAIQKISTINNKTVEDTSKAFLGTVDRLNAQNKSAINAKQLFKEIVNVSDAIKLSVGGTAEKLAEAAYKAKQFGITLQQADNIAESLLNFESSIANELSAELITGKDLNFERARLLAINGDIAGASEEILKQIKGSAEFTKMNRVQQEAIAKAVSMSRDDLAKSLVEREAAAALGAEEGQAAQDRYNELVRIHGVEKANDILGNKALERQFQQQSVQDRLANAAEKLKEIFISLVEPLMPIVDIFADIFGFIAPIVGLIGTMVKYTIQLGKYLLPIYILYKGIQVMQTASLAVNRANYAIKGLQMGQEYFISREKNVQGIMDKQNFLTRVAYNAQLLTGLISEQGIAGIKSYALTLDDKSIAKKIIIKTYDTGSLAMARLKSLFSKQDLATEKAGAATRKGNLLTNIGTATMKAIQSLASIPVIGWALGLAAAGTAVALGYKFMKGDDVMSEGGYGNRTLLTPKGSIALNNQDTVIAGTNLGGKGKSTPAPQQDNSALLNEMKAMRQEQAKANSKPTIVENSMNGTRFGTSVAMNTYKIQ